MEIVLYYHLQGRFHVKSWSGRIHNLNLNDKKCTCGKTLIYGFPCSHIIAACQHLVLIFGYLFKATTLRIHTMTLRQAYFIPYSMKMSVLFMMVQRL